MNQSISRRLATRLLRDEQMVNLLLGLTAEILQTGEIEADDSIEQRQLLLTNLVVQRDRQLVIRKPYLSANFRFRLD